MNFSSRIYSRSASYPPHSFFHKGLMLYFEMMSFQKVIALVALMVFASQGAMAAPYPNPDETPTISALKNGGTIANDVTSDTSDASKAFEPKRKTMTYLPHGGTIANDVTSDTSDAFEPKRKTLTYLPSSYGSTIVNDVAPDTSDASKTFEPKRKTMTYLPYKY